MSFRSPEKSKSEGRALLDIRDGKYYLLPGTVLLAPETSMNDANKARREKIVKDGLGTLDPETGEITLTQEYEANTRGNAWCLVMGNNDPHHENFQPTAEVFFKKDKQTVTNEGVLILLLFDINIRRRSANRSYI